MNSSNNRCVQVVKRDEKETRLTQFILGEIASGRASTSGQWRVLALTMESPVLAALERVVRDLGGTSDLEIHVILMSADKRIANGRFNETKVVHYRIAGSTRMLDAHEQLVLGERSSWTGACMRRDPRERDAFETFGSDNAQLADWATKSFDRIWAGASPVRTAKLRSDGAGVLETALSSAHALPKTSVLASSQN